MTVIERRSRGRFSAQCQVLKEFASSALGTGKKYLDFLLEMTVGVQDHMTISLNIKQRRTSFSELLANKFKVMTFERA